MSARHRRPAAPRLINRRIVGAGASGLAVVFAVVPFAHADEAPTDTTSSSAPASSAAPSSDAPSSAAPSSDAPSSAAPSSDAPSSAAPSSDAPSSAAPSSDAPSSAAPSSDAPSSAAPSSDAPSSAAPSSDAPSSSSPTPPPAAKLAPKADFGLGKSPIDANITVRVDQTPGSHVPAGATTAGSTLTLVEKDSEGAVVASSTCTTVADPAPSAGSACAPVHIQADDTLTITQTGAAPHFVVAATPTTVGNYECSYDPFLEFDTCDSGPKPVTVPVYDKGLPPVVTAASTTVTVPADKVSDVDVDGSQIDTDGAPPTSVDVTTQPTHGTVAVVADTTAPPLQARAAVATPVAGAFHFVYTPTTGYIGPDAFTYTVTTVNGTSGPATVDLRVVGAAPTARNDTTSTKQGEAVTDDVLANDTANGGGTLTLDAVTAPRHGTAQIVDGRVRYTPAPDFSGTDTVGYSVSTFSGTATATLSVTVTATAIVVPTTPAPSTSSSNGAAADANDNTVATADTGAPTAALVEIGGALLLAGAGATAIGRRRRPTGGHA